jgi:DNA-binding XRE family transcriptional regulator
LRLARAEKNIFQEGPAKLAGVSRQTISSIETCQDIPAALLAFNVAQKLKKPVEEQFFREGDDA